MASDHSPASDSSEHPSKASDNSPRSDSSDLLVLSPSPDSRAFLVPVITSYYSPTSVFPAKEKHTDHIPQKQEVKSGNRKDATYKIKEIHYLGKKRHIVLQNENGPCPLIAICNILVLKNFTDLYPDTIEVSEARLLDLVADALIDNNDVDEMLDLSFSSWQNNQEYIANQNQKIDDATSRLPCIVDGINVDLKFRRINDFLFTPELAIFGLLNISLYHGWLVNPQDYETLIAIGCKSYNELLTELVVMETQAKARSGPFSGECSVDFSTALTASIGVHSPCFSKTRLFPDSPPASAETKNLRKGDIEEEIALLKAMRTSEREALGFDIHRGSCSEGESMSGLFDENQMSEDDTLETSVDATAGCTSILGSSICQLSKADESFFDVETEKNSKINAVTSSEEISEDKTELESTKSGNTSVDATAGCTSILGSSICQLSKADESFFDVETEKNSKINAVTSSEEISEDKTELESTKSGNTSVDATAGCTSILGSSICQQSKADESFLDVETEKNSKINAVTSSEAISVEKTELESTKNGNTSEIPQKSEAGTFVNQDLSERSQDDDVPLNETKGSVSLDSPAYEGESRLGEYSSEGTDANKLTPKEGEVIRRFLNDNASQLTLHGLYSLVQGIQEGELCVFFRNNHFSTMVKYKKELYLLVTDQGYLTQRDVVWEKLNDVSGNSVFMTSDFQVFNSDRSETRRWDQSNAITNTEDYISRINNSSNDGWDIDPDFKMAMALQQQDLEEADDPYFT